MKKILCTVLGIGLVLAAGCVATPAEKTRYNVIVLGDTHFDGTETNFYHKIPGNWTVNRLNEFHRNATMWKDLMPKLLESAGKTASRRNADFVLQLGDIAQGDCPDYNGHKKIVSDAFETLKHYFPDIPLLPVMGNHDFRSPNGRKAYIDFMMPQVSKETGLDIKAPNFVVKHGPDAFIFLDFNQPDIPFMKKALKENTGARYTFVISHGLLFPDSGSDWFMLGRGSKPEDHAEMFALFAANKVIAISGHVHRTEFIDYAKDGGQVSQLVLSSVRTGPVRDAIEPVLGDKPQDYGMGKFSDGKFPKIMAPFAPFITSYFSTKAAGYMLLKVSDKEVVAEFYPGDSLTSAKTFKIR